MRCIALSKSHRSNVSSTSRLRLKCGAGPEGPASDVSAANPASVANLVVLGRVPPLALLALLALLLALVGQRLRQPAQLLSAAVVPSGSRALEI